MNHTLCDSCETARYCSNNGCIPLVPLVTTDGGARIEHGAIVTPEDAQGWCRVLVAASVALVAIAVATALYFR